MSALNCTEGLELQVAEVDMLTSMYSNPGEFVLDDAVSLDQVKAVVSGSLDIEDLDTRLGFTVRVSCRKGTQSLIVELVCQLPHEYPFLKPLIFTRCPDLSRERHKVLREDLSKQLDELALGEIMVGVLVEWLQERLYAELPYLESKPVNNRLTSDMDKRKTGVGRLWIYSHHIYSKIKRRDIQNYAEELALHGFSMPGKPGVICAEGATCDVDEFWYRIRRMNWKKICIKEQEVIPVAKDADLSCMYKFEPFSELVLDARGGKGREYHMDLGKFYSYLQDHESGHIFNLFFGVEGKQADEAE